MNEHIIKNINVEKNSNDLQNIYINEINHLKQNLNDINEE